MIYLDEAAISKPRKEVVDIVNDILRNHWFNPNSVYDEGLEARRMILNAKKIIANEINCNEEDLVMCSSGSEANTMALMGVMKAYDYPHFITSPIEHASIMANPYAKPIITVDKEGKFDIVAISRIHDKFVSIGYANSEIGTIQNIKEITKILKDNGCLVHVDATAIFGRIKLNMKELNNIDAMTFAAQKIGGIIGSACLYIRPGIKVEPLIYGHNTLHGGTPNTAAICAFGKAVELLDYDEIKEIQKMRDYLVDKLLEIPNITLNGSHDSRIFNNVNICIHDIEVDNQQLIALLDMMSYCSSASTACAAGSKEPSKTLLAIGLSKEEANSSLRLTLSLENTYAELDAFVSDLKNIIEQFSKKLI